MTAAIVPAAQKNSSFNRKVRRSFRFFASHFRYSVCTISSTAIRMTRRQNPSWRGKICTRHQNSCPAEEKHSRLSTGCVFSLRIKILIFDFIYSFPLSLPSPGRLLRDFCFLCLPPEGCSRIALFYAFSLSCTIYAFADFCTDSAPSAFSASAAFAFARKAAPGSCLRR